MPTTTTYDAIRDNYIAKLMALTPTILSELKFQRNQWDEQLRDAAAGNGSSAIRVFEFQRGKAEEPPYEDPQAFERNEQMLLLVAYPTLLAFYGRDDLDDVEKVMRRDAAQIRDCIFSGGNYLAGQSAAFVEIMTPDRADPRVWFQQFTISLIYTESQTLT